MVWYSCSRKKRKNESAHNKTVLFPIFETNDRTTCKFCSLYYNMEGTKKLRLSKTETISTSFAVPASKDEKRLATGGPPTATNNKEENKKSPEIDNKLIKQKSVEDGDSTDTEMEWSKKQFKTSSRRRNAQRKYDQKKKDNIGNYISKFPTILPVQKPPSNHVDQGVLASHVSIF